MLQQPHPDQLRHARALFASGWLPHERLVPGDVLGTVRKIDTLQHVDVGAWQAMHLMADLPVRGEVLAGNPEIRIQQPGQPPDTPSRTDNGIMTRVPGQYLAQASHKLPTPCLAEAGQPIRTSAIDVPSLGLVRVTFELSQHKHGRSRFWSWRPRRADQVQAGAE